MNVLSKDLVLHWAMIEPILTIRNQRQYDQAVRYMNHLLDEIGDDENHPLAGLLDTLGAVVQAYEELHHPMPAVKGRDMLRHLMEEHGLTQSELPEIGSKGVVSEILAGKRELNTRQISALAKRFHVSPAVFI
jgi:HTH-type transcriptional regulator/antitoxin HigA